MPAGTVEHHGGVLVLGQRCGELGKELVHRHGRDLRQHESEALAGGRPDGGEEVGPAIALVAQAGRALAAGEPAMADAPLLAKSGLIHEPQRQALVAVLSSRVIEGGLQPPFANASRAAASAFGCDGRAFCHDKSSWCISLPRCEGWYDTLQRCSTSRHSSDKVQALRPVASASGPSSTTCFSVAL